MSYIEKQTKILAKLKETDYNAFDGDKTAAMKFIEKHLLIIAGYTTAVTKADITAAVNSDKKESKKAYKETTLCVTANSIATMNTLCTKLGLEKFMDIDTTDLTAVKNAVGEYTTELYNAGIGKKQ